MEGGRDSGEGENEVSGSHEGRTLSAWAGGREPRLNFVAFNADGGVRFPVVIPEATSKAIQDVIQDVIRDVMSDTAPVGFGAYHNAGAGMRLVEYSVTTFVAAAVFVGVLPGAITAQELDAPRPIEALNSVWIEELTWMEVRDEIAAGKTTAIISTGGVEPNGPYVATGKHNFVLESACDWLARELGDALCAPIVKLVPEGNIDPPSGHMQYPGTISVRQETFEAILEDVGRSLAAHGFTDIIYIGDSGGNARGMRTVATMLTEEWAAAGRGATAHHIGEFYNYSEI